MKRFRLMIFAFCFIHSLRISLSDKVTMWIIGDPHIYSIQNGHEICDYSNFPNSEIILQITGLTIYATFGNVNVTTDTGNFQNKMTFDFVSLGVFICLLRLYNIY